MKNYFYILISASAKGEFQLEGFTINMTSLDDIFIQATKSGRGNEPSSAQVVSLTSMFRLEQFL